MTVELVLIVTGPDAGAVQEYQSEAFPALARVAVGAGSPASADDSRLSPAIVPLTPASVVRWANASLAGRAGITTEVWATGPRPSELTAATPRTCVPGVIGMM